MASSPSTTAAATSSASTGIERAFGPDPTNQIPVSSNDKGNENPGNLSTGRDPNDRKNPLSFLQNLFKFKKKKPGEENEPSPEEDESVEIKEEADALTRLIEADLHFIKTASDRTEKIRDPVDLVTKTFDEVRKVPGNAKDLRQLKKIVKALKEQISTKDSRRDYSKDLDFSEKLKAISGATTRGDDSAALEILPNLFEDPDFEKTLQYNDFKAQYDELPIELKLCLLCFSVFPDNAEIKRRVMTYWWIGEGFVPPRANRPQEGTNPDRTKFALEEDRNPEQWANHYFDILLKMGFIESAHRKTNAKVDSCRMHPFVRMMLNKLAQRTKFFDLDDQGNVTETFSKSLRLCLLEDKKLPEDKPQEKLWENLHAIFNVDKEILDFNRELISKMINLNVLYLGRWQSKPTHHIEVDESKTLKTQNANVLDGLENVKYLRFLSLQGVSRITELPKSIFKLKNLTILDIRASHNLEKIPDGIGWLVNLTHLDVSECYLLDEMPKGISCLTKLQVLSGFVVGGSDPKTSCTLDDLKSFPELRKLSIHSGSEAFPSKEDLMSLNQLKKLRKLTIVWGRGSARREEIGKQDGDEKSLKNSGSLETGKAKRKADTVKQDDDQVGLSTAQSPKKKGKVKSDALAAKRDVNQGGLAKAQSPKGEGRKRKEEINVKKQAKTENLQDIGTPNSETREGAKMKGILKRETREIRKALELGSEGASTSRQVNFPAETEEREVVINSEKSEALQEKSPEQKSATVLQAAPTTSPKTKGQPNATGRFKRKGLGERLGHGLGRLPSIRSTKGPTVIPIPELPSQLVKLDLQCLPGKPHDWLRPCKLPNLGKLYIRGGKFYDLGQFQDYDDSNEEVVGLEKEKWTTVKELRLKYLDELEMDWRELLELFPKLEYLEKVDCPKLSFFPCDETGVWMNEKKI